MMTRDELARHLYITTPDTRAPLVPVSQEEQEVLAQRWDNGGAHPGYAADCYARVDQMIADRQVPA